MLVGRNSLIVEILYIHISTNSLNKIHIYIDFTKYMFKVYITGIYTSIVCAINGLNYITKAKAQI